MVSLGSAHVLYTMQVAFWGNNDSRRLWICERRPKIVYVAELMNEAITERIMSSQPSKIFFRQISET